MTRVLFLHPAVRSYRFPLFVELGRRGVHFLFTSINAPDTAAGKETDELLSHAPFVFYQAKEIVLGGKKNFSFDLWRVFKYDVIIFSGVTSIPFLLLAAPLYFLRKKVVVFDELWAYPQGKEYSYLRPLVRFLAKKMVRSFIPAGSKAAEFLNNEFNIPQDRLHVAYNTAPEPKPPTQHADIDMRYLALVNKVKGLNRPVLLYLGRVVQYKGLDVLLQALAAMPNPPFLLVVGEGDYLTDCKKLTNILEIENDVMFWGGCASQDVSLFYSLADLFVLPARRTKDDTIGYEAWGFTVNEAMWMRVPVLATNAVGAAYDLLLQHRTGWICQEGSVESLALMLQVTLKDKVELVSVGQRGYEWLKQRCSYSQNVRSIMSAVMK